MAFYRKQGPEFKVIKNKKSMPAIVAGDRFFLN